MKLLFLRGQVPRDRDPGEIKWKSWEDCTDVWLQLVEAAATDVEVVYWGGNRQTRYTNRLNCVWAKSLKKYQPPWQPDVIFARGGFPEYQTILKRYPRALHIYAGAGVRTMPDRKYDMVLVDTCADKFKVECKYPKTTVVMLAKPAASQFLYQDRSKKYDVCFIANGNQAKIKRVKWVYKTVPENISVLHLGSPSCYSPPLNLSRRRVLQGEMPDQIAKCRVGIAPYTSYDGGPRAVPEMLAMGLPVVVLPDTRIFPYRNTHWVQKKGFWDVVSNLRGLDNGRGIALELAGVDTIGHNLGVIIERRLYA